MPSSSPLAALVLLARDALERQRATFGRARSKAERASDAEAVCRERVARLDREIHAERRSGERLDVQTLQRAVAYRALLASELARSQQERRQAVEEVGREQAQLQENALQHRVLETGHERMVCAGQLRVERQHQRLAEDVFASRHHRGGDG